ncbi:MAG: antibiotic biosynthesis monooxygenase [Actinomycetota bacterium]
MSETTKDTAPVSATVVLAQRPKPGREDEYRRWQAEINDACRTFPGFEGVEVIPPVPGIQQAHVVIFRFDSFGHLDAWLSSDTRGRLLDRGRDLFAEEPRRHVVAEPAAGQGSAMVVSTRVKPGRDREYRAWQDTINAEAARYPGFLGNEVIPPVPDVQDEWVTLLRFDTPEHLRNWLASDVRMRLVDEAAGLWDETRVEGFSGSFPGWFASGSTGPDRAAAPPNWKQAMIVLLVLYPIVAFMDRFLSPRLASLPVAIAIFIGNAVSVAVLTWVLMPGANRAFRSWLTPAGGEGRLVELRGIALVVAGYVVAIAIFLVLR